MEAKCPHCDRRIAYRDRVTTINDITHHVDCANAKWRAWFGVDLVPQRATA